MTQQLSKPSGQLPPYRGMEVWARYSHHELPEFAGNPLTEALPPMPDEETLVDLLEYRPVYREDRSGWSDRTRKSAVHRSARHFAVLPMHKRLANKLLEAIFQGYIGRNPSLKGFFRSHRENVKRLLKSLGLTGVVLGPDDDWEKEGEWAGPESDRGELDAEGNFEVPGEDWDDGELLSDARGFHFIGVSGMGKTTTLLRILKLIPQLIYHRVYGGTPLCCQQVTWLHVECPKDGSLIQLCRRSSRSWTE